MVRHGSAEGVTQMNNLEKKITWALAVVGAVSGLWGAYTAYDASKFKQPFDEHDQVTKSYQAQIVSAEKRKDAPEVARVRLRFEEYEEKWRAARQIVQIVAPIESLAAVQITAEQDKTLKELLPKSSKGPWQT